MQLWLAFSGPGYEERNPRGDEKRLGWMATHPGAALLQDRGGQVSCIWCSPAKKAQFPVVNVAEFF